ncbi:hypothetical protein KHP11_25700 [Rhodococcus erythropolis]|jgi:hypothetical protein|uniref:Spore coat protein n=1 Tax=Rhodococcus globerulus TaxID=33008 RepID=A0ABU4BTZ0_RHOGO|nr:MULTISPECIES: hypothetical protein [Rhodococcus]MCD2155053.1 hypothetical protein [Rhodococcus cerastii]MBT1257865.1 hypothetical protein [Rhodococcus erythropolis]MDI9909258.1 hypothetical protein [Rhodococcus sp. IEGM 1406]MDV6267702.1 hypothetical protein [Rhodococcus globerulus]MDV8065695.1 hypothetical protein [Rhodococcus sp. IEGM 1366]
MFNDVFNNVIHPMVTNFQQLGPQQFIPQQFIPQQFIPQGLFQQAPQAAEQAVTIFGS